MMRIIRKVEALSLDDLLEELDRREVRYRATASKRQLQRLLLRHILQSSPTLAQDRNRQTAHVRRPSRVTKQRVTTATAASSQPKPPQPSSKKKRLGKKRNSYADNNDDDDWSLQKAAMATLTLAGDAAIWTAKNTRKKYYRIRQFTDQNLHTTKAKQIAYSAASKAYSRTRDLFQKRDGRKDKNKDEIYNAKWHYVTKEVDYEPSPPSKHQSPQSVSYQRTATPVTKPRKEDTIKAVVKPLPPVSPQPFTTHTTISSKTTNNATETANNIISKKCDTKNGFVIRPTSQPPTPTPPVNATTLKTQKYDTVPYSNTRQKYDSRQQQTNKTIYSPYAQQQQNEENDFFVKSDVALQKASQQIFDSIGEQIDNVIDLGAAASEAQASSPKTKSDGKKQHQHRRYWRDRLSERFDKLLGLHENGKYYNSWQEQLEDIEKRQRQRQSQSNRRSNRKRTRVDPFDIANGYPVETHHEQQARRKKEEDNFFKIPFWEQDGSLMNLLFGKRRGGKGKVTIKEIFQNDMSQNNICTSLFKSLFRSMIILASYTCKWASVRGALPQPVVVFGVSTAAICAPRKRRFMTVVVTLVALRTLGEALHGYVYGNEDWEDDYDYNNDANVIIDNEENEYGGDKTEKEGR